MMESREQKLIDICFSIGLMIQSHESFAKKTTEETAEWVAWQLKLSGFPTEPIGSSWGVLIK